MDGLMEDVEMVVRMRCDVMSRDEEKTTWIGERGVGMCVGRGVGSDQIRSDGNGWTEKVLSFVWEGRMRRKIWWMKNLDTC